MTLHIFNPEHDIALASGLSNFTAPHAGRQLRHDLGFLPAIWAADGDAVMVDDVEQAVRSWQRIRHRIKTLVGAESSVRANVEFAPTKTGVYSGQTFGVEPWGWNLALRAQLMRLGVSELQLPTVSRLETVRELSHRHTAATLLPRLRMEGTVGQMFECQTPEQVDALLSEYGQLVLKAPWSSSGRGLRFINSRSQGQHSAFVAGWMRNVVEQQGCVMVEPYYNKVKDFGMEFVSDGKGRVSYLGLSLFHTENGAYTGNVLATEAAKASMINRYIPDTLLSNIQESICRELGPVFNGRYCGPLGVDMMVVGHPEGQGCLLHPCVEINLRRTMGHVALALSPHDDDLRLVMRIDYSDNNYQLKILRT